MNLHDVHHGIRRHRKPRRIGRGPGSGHGKTATRGHKGQGQLAGYTQHAGFEGGQMPLYRRVPKRGFNNRWARLVRVVNVGQLNAAFQDGDEVTPDSLRRLVKGRYDLLKVLGDGELTKQLKVSAHRFSQSALDKIQQAGGQALVLPSPAPVVKGVKKSARKAAQTG